jgi:hypothetical protein
MVLGLLAIGAAVPHRRVGLVHLLILAFIAWGAIRTLPYLQTYRIDAFRDAVVWGYAAFALTVSLLMTPDRIHKLVGLYGRLVPLFLVWVPLFALVWQVALLQLPVVPGTNVRIPYFKAGDLSVHLAGSAAFMLAGLLGHGGWRPFLQPLLWAVWLGGFVILSALNRGGMVAMAAVSGLLLFIRSPARWGTVMLVGLCLLSIAVLTNVRVELGGPREASVAQLVENIQSIVGESDDPALAGTRRWREDWWDSIVDYTIFGPNFWGGKGFGINLAIDDKISAPDETLRAPHNAHLNILARAGVPGLALWMAVQAGFAIALIRAAMTAARARARYWLAIIGWIFVYWLAALANMTFDVYLEGPQGGIFFWSLMGFGLAVAAFIQNGIALDMDRDGERVTQDPAPSAGLPGARVGRAEA